jgi:hypothetical protein
VLESRGLRLAFLGLSGVALGLALAATLVRAAYPYDVAPGEGTEIYYTLRLVRGEPIYGYDRGFPYLYDVYPPGFYLALAPLVAAFGPHLVWGRLVSLVASAALALLVARWTRSFGAREEVGLALAAAAVCSPTVFNWLVLSRADALGTLLGCAAVAAAEARRRGAGVALGVVTALAVAATYTRQSNGALALAAYATLAWDRPREARRGIIAYTAACVLALGALQLATGGAFWPSIASTLSWGRTAGYKWALAGRYVGEQAGVFALVVGTLGWPAARARVPRAVWLGLVAAVPQASQIARVGAGPNYLLPLHVFAVIAAAGALVVGRARFSWAAPIVLALQLGGDIVGLHRQLDVVPPGSLPSMRRLETYLRTLPGPLLLDRQVMLYIRTGARPGFVETAGLGLDVFHGGGHLEELEQWMREGRYSAILLRPDTLLPPALRPSLEKGYARAGPVLLIDGAYTLWLPRRADPQAGGPPPRRE